MNNITAQRPNGVSVFTLECMAAKIRAGDRRQLAKAITLAESSRERDNRLSNALLDELLPHTGGAIRLGVSGLPGVGKSTFIETLGCYLCDQQWRVAVLSIDPSSSLNGGSILGDKTRMPGLSAHTNAYIRPTPSGDALGGVAGATRESILLCEAAGFNVILVETVGVGQSEIAVADMTDIFLLLLLPSTGDELQGIKRGIVERADIILINKADGALLNAAQQTVADYRSALQLLRKNTLTGADIPGVDNPVMPMSALDRAGIQGIWGNLLSHWQALNKNPALEDKRQQQRLNWMREKLHSAVYRLALKNLATRQSLEQFEALVSQASLSPGSAIEQIMDALG